MIRDGTSGDKVMNRCPFCGADVSGGGQRRVAHIMKEHADD